MEFEQVEQVARTRRRDFLEQVAEGPEVFPSTLPAFASSFVVAEPDTSAFVEESSKATEEQ